MKKDNKIALLIVGAVFVGLVTMGVGASQLSNTQTVPNSNTNATTGQSVPAQVPAEPAKEKITIKSSVYQDKGHGFSEVIGEVTNNDTAKRTISLKATFYDTSGKILGTATGIVNELGVGETKTFNLHTNDKVDNHANFKVQVDSLF